ncbi:MAG: DUF3445 domain-containing protein [Pseudomonadota bacterium]
MAPSDWLLFDDAEAGQLALRRQLLVERRHAVLRALPGSEAAQAEAVAMIAAHLREDHGRDVALEGFEDLAGAIQEDVVILEKRGEAHVMVAALLCFPASWMLAEKIGRAMAVIHEPVREIGPRMDRQIERVFDAVRVGRPMWRYNQLWYHEPALFHPRSANDRREKPEGEGNYLRTERQCLVRMPETGCIMFTIHTYVVAREDVVST